MSEPLSPRVRAMRDSLRAERLRNEEAAGARTKSGSPDTWLQPHRADDIPIQIQGVTDTPAIPSGATNDPWLPDPAKDLVPADSQAAAGNSLHDVLEHAAEDDSLLEEALQRSLESTRSESGQQAQRTRQAAQSQLQALKDRQITATAKEFIARSKQATGTEYCSDDDGSNYILVLQELNRLHKAGVFIDADDPEEATRAFFAKNLWTVENLLRAWKSLVDSGNVAALYEGAREISSAERAQAKVQAAQGTPQALESAIVGLMQIAFPSLANATSEAELFQALSSDENRSVIYDIVFSCVSATSQAVAMGLTDSPQTRAAVAIALGNAPISVANVLAAFHQSQRSRQPRSLEEQHDAALTRPVTDTEIDDLDDASVQQLFDSVVNDRTRARKRLL